MYIKHSITFPPVQKWKIKNYNLTIIYKNVSFWTCARHQANVLLLLLKEILKLETQKSLWCVLLMSAVWNSHTILSSSSCLQSNDPCVNTFTSIFRWTKVYWLQCCCFLNSRLSCVPLCCILTYCTCSVYGDAFLTSPSSQFLVSVFSYLHLLYLEN